ncbi:MAG: polyprenyl synthetase family protein [Mariprofundaceae bacterium]
MSASQLLAEHASQVNEALESMMQARKAVVPERLQEAMNYSLLAPGKRIRPTLMLECYTACGGSKDMMNAALSVECIHAYSLIHDDLPCMDDDDLRRGRPTCHKKFGQATAILSADALQTLGFELLTDLTAPDHIRCQLIHKMSIAAGAQGMVGGQMLDMLSNEVNIENLLDVERIHVHKTGALLCYCCEAGALLAVTDDSRINACTRFGKAVGLLFQIADDILDATASSSELGKSAGKDASQHKATYVSVLGIEQARELAGEMLELALSAIEPLGSRGERLRQLACYILERRQ